MKDDKLTANAAFPLSRIHPEAKEVHAMLRFIVKRFFQSLLVVFVVILFIFVLVRLAPGNPARLMLGDFASEEQIAAMEVKMGLDKPIITQFFIYLGDLLHGDLGTSTVYGMPVTRIIFQRMPVTAALALSTVVVAALLAIPLGIFAGANRGRVVEIFCMVFALLGQSISGFWLGIMLIWLFSVNLGWLPSLGTGSPAHLVLPVITLAYPMAASITRIARSGMIDTLGEDYITATYAKGVSNVQVYLKYALRNAMIPVVTILALDLGRSLAGAVVAESVFSRAGVGQLLNQSVSNRDYAMVQATLMISAVLFTFINFIADIVNSIVDPRLTLN